MNIMKASLCIFCKVIQEYSKVSQVKNCNSMALQVGSLVVAEMLYRTNLVAMVAGGRKPKFADNTVLCYKYVKRYKYKTMWTF